MLSPPESLHCGPVQLRRWSLADLPALVAAASASWDHLRPWMPWAQHEPTAQNQRPWLTSAVEQWETGEAYQYAVLAAGDEAVIGSVGLMRRIGPGAMELGYWVHAASVRRAVATRAAAAASWAGLALPEVDRLEIRCDATNRASAAAAARLSFTLSDHREMPVTAPAETGVQQLWVLSAEYWRSSRGSSSWAAEGAPGGRI